MKRNFMLFVCLLGLVASAGLSLASPPDIRIGPSIRVPSTPTTQLQPSIAVDIDGNINITWDDCRQGFDSEDVYFSRSTDGGWTWSTEVKVNDEHPGSSKFSSLGLDAAGKLYVAWEQEPEGNVYFSMSTDSGKSWSSDVRVNEDAPGWQGAPSLAVDPDGNIYVTWYDERNGLSDIYFARSTDAGSTWTTPNVRVNSPSSGYQLGSHTAVDDSGRVYVVWDDSRSGIDDVYFSFSQDGGKSWSPDVRVNDDEHRHVNDPHVALSKEGIIYVVWESEDICFARSTDNGQRWTNPNIKVNSDSLTLLEYSQPWIRVDDQGRISVVWRGRSGPEDDYKTHIYCAMSSDSGNTWTDPEIRVDDSLCIAAELPSLDVGPYGNLYIAWDGDRITMQPVQIFFARGWPIITVVPEAPQAGTPKEFKLLQNYPNPFNSKTAVSYQLSAVSPLHTTLKIYDILGQQIRKLVEKEQGPGFYNIRWDGKDDKGKEVASGVYFCRLQNGDLVATKKLLLLR